MSFYSKLFGYTQTKTVDPKPTFTTVDTEIVVAKNEANERVILEFTKPYKGVSRV
jgi:hypothetical protein